MPLPKLLIVSFLSLTFLTGINLPKKESPEKRRAEIDGSVSIILADLQEQVPGSEQYLEQSAGYAVFSSVGINVLALSTANGKGVAHYGDGRRVYMKMYSAGVGVGMGVKDYRLVFVFETEVAMNKFVNEGWTAGTQADAAATHNDQGDAAALAIDVSPGVRLFQITESGLALQATIQGTKYLKDDDLN